ncbi:hypothetical protein Tco_0949081 [Tanacetum coccineum]
MLSEMERLLVFFDIATCLYDVIARMDRAADTTTDVERVQKHWEPRPVTVSPSDTVLKAAKTMLEFYTNSTTITCDSKPEGILTSVS